MNTYVFEVKQHVIDFVLKVFKAKEEDYKYYMHPNKLIKSEPFTDLSRYRFVAEILGVEFTGEIHQLEEFELLLKEAEQTAECAKRFRGELLPGFYHRGSFERSFSYLEDFEIKNISALKYSSEDIVLDLNLEFKNGIKELIEKRSPIIDDLFNKGLDKEKLFRTSTDELQRIQRRMLERSEELERRRIDKLIEELSL